MSGLDDATVLRLGGWHEGARVIVTATCGDAGFARLAHACDEAEPGTVVVVRHHGVRTEVVTGSSGWWVFVAPRASDEDDELPEVLAQHPPG